MLESNLIEVAKAKAPLATNWQALGLLISKDIPLSEGRWRGIKKNNPDFAKEISKLLGNHDSQMIAQVGVSADEEPDFDEVLAKMEKSYQGARDKELRKQAQRVEFANGPIGIACFADVHIGSNGTDIKRFFSELQAAVDTPNVYILGMGDWVDNFIVEKLLHIRMGTTNSIPDEWIVARRALQIAKDKMIGMVGGNHEFWTVMKSGVDILKETVRLANPSCIYDTDELRINFVVDGVEYLTRARHKWRNGSVLNPTHGIERAYERDQAVDFQIGIGAHTHVGCYVREFNAGGRTGLAVQCGTYKRLDSFGKRVGFAESNRTTAPMIVLHPDYIDPIGISNLYAGIEALNGYSGRR